MSVLSQICNTFEVNFKKTTQIVLKQSKQQFMLLISTKEVLSRWVPTLMRETLVQFIFQHVSFVADIYYFPGAFHFKLLKEFLKQYKKQFMHLISTKEVLSRWVPTLKREKPFVTVFLPSCQFCGRYAILSRLFSKKKHSKVLKQSKQQFMHLISTNDVLSLWVPTFKREKPFVTVFLPSCQFCGRYAILSRLISKKKHSKVLKQSNSNLCI